MYLVMYVEFGGGTGFSGLMWIQVLHCKVPMVNFPDQGLVSELVEGADVIKRGIIEIAAAALFLPFSVIGSHAADLPTAVMSLFSSDFSALQL